MVTGHRKGFIPIVAVLEAQGQRSPIHFDGFRVPFVPSELACRHFRNSHADHTVNDPDG